MPDGAQVNWRRLLLEQDSRGNRLVSYVPAPEP